MNMIRLEDLAGACSEQLELFDKTFPEGAPVTAESMAVAMAAGLNVQWLENLLPVAALAEHVRISQAVRQEFDRSIEDAIGLVTGADFYRTCSKARNKLNSAIADSLLEKLKSL